MHQASSTFSLTQRSKEAMIRGLIWAFIGLLYAMIFVFFTALIEHWQWPVNPVFLAGILSASLGALIYSSMRLAVLMTIIVSPVSIFYFILASWPIDLTYLLATVAIIGALIGALYGRFSRGSRVHRADAKTLAGFSAGWVASLGYLTLSSLYPDVSLNIVIAIMCPVTGFLYVWMVPGFIKHYEDLLPPIGDGVIVGVGVSTFVSLTFLVMISTVDDGVAGPLLGVLHQVEGMLSPAVIGGVLGGGFAGIVSGLLLTQWQDL